MRATWPSIDHSLLSPSGRMSKRARRAAEDREFARLFADSNIAPRHAEPTPQERAVALRRSARNLRDLAARGMKPRAYAKAAEKLEREAEALLAEAGG